MEIQVLVLEAEEWIPQTCKHTQSEGQISSSSSVYRPMASTLSWVWGSKRLLPSEIEKTSV